MTERGLLGLGVVVRDDGNFDDVARSRFLRLAVARGIPPAPAPDAPTIDNPSAKHRPSQARYARGTVPCADRLGFDTSDCSLSAASANVERRALLELVKRATRPPMFAAPDSSSSEPFRFELEHDQHQPRGRLRALHFLRGRFCGEARHVHDSRTFDKVVVGAYEAGGRFMTLRMETRHPTSTGGTELHHALVVVGAAARSDQLIGTAFSDCGDIHEYVIELTAAGIQFDEQLPQHEASPWQRLRKFLSPIKGGYEERLEVDRGDGFEPFHRIAMMCAAASSEVKVASGVNP